VLAEREEGGRREKDGKGGGKRGKEGGRRGNEGEGRKERAMGVPCSRSPFHAIAATR